MKSPNEGTLKKNVKLFTLSKGVNCAKRISHTSTIVHQTLQSYQIQNKKKQLQLNLL